MFLWLPEVDWSIEMSWIKFCQSRHCPKTSSTARRCTTSRVIHCDIHLYTSLVIFPFRALPLLSESNLTLEGFDYSTTAASISSTVQQQLSRLTSEFPFTGVTVSARKDTFCKAKPSRVKYCRVSSWIRILDSNPNSCRKISSNCQSLMIFLRQLFGLELRIHIQDEYY